MSEEIETQYVYLDANDEVVASSVKERELTEPKLVSLSATSKVAGADMTIVYRGQPHMDTYHRRVSGDGTSLADYEELEYVDHKKAEKIAEIDARTVELIEAGFDYNGEHFSMSPAAQMNWTQLQVHNITGAVTFPVGVSTSDDGEYQLQDAADFVGFITAIAGLKIASYDGGRVLKLQVKAATTLAEVAAVVDNR